MGDIKLSANFELNKASALDSRTVVAVYADLANITFKYSGLQVFVIADQKYYYYSGSVWQEFSGGSGSSGSVTIIAENGLTKNSTSGAVELGGDLDRRTFITCSNIPFVISSANNHGLHFASAGLYSSSGLVLQSNSNFSWTNDAFLEGESENYNVHSKFSVNSGSAQFKIYDNASSSFFTSIDLNQKYLYNNDNTIVANWQDKLQTYSTPSSSNDVVPKWFLDQEISNSISTTTTLNSSSFKALDNIYTANTKYVITNADLNLYGGTEITFVTDINSKLNKKGIGKFYNPKYDQNFVGFGIWSNLSSFVATPTGGTWIKEENITGQNGATGKLFTTILGTKFIALSGDWSVVTSITGDFSGATATIASVVQQNCSVDSKIIWGGKVWENLNGNVGSATNQFTLNSEWQVVNYNSTDYNIVYDEIEYDIENDLITYRTDNSNIVSFSKDLLSKDYYYFNTFYPNISPIKFFQFGNTSKTIDKLGIYKQNIIESFNENINFRGLRQYNLNLKDSAQYATDFINSSQFDIDLNNSKLYICKFVNATQSQIILDDSNFYELLIQNSTQTKFEFLNDSNVNNIVLENTSTQTNLKLNKSQIANLNFNNSDQLNICLENNSNMQQFVFHYSVQSNIHLENNASQTFFTFTDANQNNITAKNSDQSYFVLSASTQQRILLENLTEQSNFDFNSSTQEDLELNACQSHYLTFLNLANHAYSKYFKANFSYITLDTANIYYNILENSNQSAFDLTDCEHTNIYMFNSAQAELNSNTQHQRNLTFRNFSYLWGSTQFSATTQTADMLDVEFVNSTEQIYDVLTTDSVMIKQDNQIKEISKNDFVNGLGVLTATSSAVLNFSGGLTLATNGLTLTNVNVVLNAVTGTKIGTATTQKLGFYNATPVVQPSATTDLGVVLSNLGLRAVGTAYTITTSGTVSISGTTTLSSTSLTNTLTISNGVNIVTATSTGTKICTATNQRIGFWNAAPIPQPTTAIVATTFVANTSNITNDTATFDGYSIGQVVKALRNVGLLA